MASTLLEFVPPIRALLEACEGGGRVMPLVPEGPLQHPQLDSLRLMTSADLFAGESVASEDAVRCVHAGLFLYFSALDESHAIAQGVATASGSYWHGIMHRQEPDWSNAKYWFRRTGDHPVFQALARETGEPWDPFQFVDRCSAAVGGSEDPAEVARLQMLEWRLLMRYCHRQALGR